MIDKYWYDKIASSAAEAEAVLVQAVNEAAADKTAGVEEVMSDAGGWLDDKARAVKEWLASNQNQEALMGGAAGGLLGAGLGYAAGGGTGALLGGLTGAGLGAYGMYNYDNIDPRLLYTGTGAALGGLAGAGLGYMTGNGMNAALGGLAGAGLGAAGAYMYPEIEPKLGSYTGSAWLDDKINSFNPNV